MSSRSSGVVAEQKAADFLRRQGFFIVDRNWRTRWCEIDIVAKKDNCLHFIEVKYRSSDYWGSAVDYITPLKLKHMRRGAVMWVKRYRWTGKYQLAALGIDGSHAQLYFIDH